MEEIMFERAVPYIEEVDGVYRVNFIEPGTTKSSYDFNNLRDAKICALEVMDLVKIVVTEGRISNDMVSKEVFEIEPLVSESTDEYGFKTVRTEPYKGEATEEIFDAEGNLITAEEKANRIEAIRKAKEEKLAAEVKEEEVPAAE